MLTLLDGEPVQLEAGAELPVPSPGCDARVAQLEAEDDDIQAIEDIERQFCVKQKVRQALIKARLYGGAALFIAARGGVRELVEKHGSGP